MMWQAQSHFTNSPGDGYAYLWASDESRGPHKVCPGHAVSVGSVWGVTCKRQMPPLFQESL